jgi:type VI secretion system protein ImpH
MVAEGGRSAVDLRVGEETSASDPGNGSAPGMVRARRQPPATPAPSSHPRCLERRLFDESCLFDFFQAARLLHRLDPGRVAVGRGGPPQSEVVRFRARVSLSFPPSSIYELRRPTTALPVPVMVQAFLGLTGPSGVLPRHYTELLYRIERDVKGIEKHALRDWLDLFNHRFVSLFYRAWEKYRFYIPYERQEYDSPEPDTFTSCLYSLIGLGVPSLRRRLRVSAREVDAKSAEAREWVLARIEDLTLLRFSGMLAHRPRCAVALEAILSDYFQVPARVQQFQGQWLQLGPVNRSRLDGELGNNQLGISAVAGDRVWETQSKFRVRLGPLSYDQFLVFLPDRDPTRGRKTFFLLVHLVRLYVESTLDFDVQLVLRAEEVPECQLTGVGTFGARLGWNTWLRTRNFVDDADDVVLEGEEVLCIDKA